uniref:Uncharacterized protein n=1 Tax=Cuerna arida TaxID=1464854 RepID=A0A1B6ETI9_9HEMI
MDYKDVLFGFSLLCVYTVTILTYAAIGNTLAGHKIRKVNDFINPVSKEFRDHYGTARKPNLFFLLFYLLFFIALIGSTTQIMKLRSIFRDWIDRMTGNREEEVTVFRLHPAAPLTPAAVDQGPPAKPKTPETTLSSTSLGSESSKTKVKGSRSRSGGRKARSRQKDTAASGVPTSNRFEALSDLEEDDPKKTKSPT